jgi:endonuclease G
MPRKPAQKRIAQASDLLNKQRKEWLSRPGVTAVDVGFKISDNKITSTLALRVHVERKKPLAELAEYEIFNVSGADATAKNKPKKIGSFPIDVIEAIYVPSVPVVVDPENAAAVNEAIDRTGVVAPLVGGISCGNPRVTAGTLACIVFSRTDGSPHILSNWHVLAGSTDAAAGEEIWQPARVDGGNSSYLVARLAKFQLGRGMDAAIAKLTGDRDYVRDIIGLTPVTGMEEPELGMNVAKSGRTTANTEGMIDGVSLSTAINYGGSTGTVSYRDQIHIVPRPPWPGVDYELSAGGDSGSVWINEDTGKAVGLHFAGEIDASPTSENAIACPIIPVADELGFSFLPVVNPTPPTEPPPPPPANVLRDIICRIFPFLCGSHESAQVTMPESLQTGRRDVVDLIIEAIYEDIRRSQSQ